VSGKNEPIKHLEMMTPVIADAAYKPKASTTYDERVTMTRISATSTRLDETIRKGSGRRHWVNQPNAARGNGRRIPPTMVRGRRYSGRPLFFAESRSRTYILSRYKLQSMTAKNEPAPVICQH
jgi:hypothetical protein